MGEAPKSGDHGPVFLGEDDEVRRRGREVGRGPCHMGPAVSRDASARKFAGVRERTGPSARGGAAKSCA